MPWNEQSRLAKEAGQDLLKIWAQIVIADAIRIGKKNFWLFSELVQLKMDSRVIIFEVDWLPRARPEQKLMKMGIEKQREAAGSSWLPAL